MRAHSAYNVDLIGGCGARRLVCINLWPIVMRLALDIQSHGSCQSEIDSIGNKSW